MKSLWGNHWSRGKWMELEAYSSLGNPLVGKSWASWAQLQKTKNGQNFLYSATNRLPLFHPTSKNISTPPLLLQSLSLPLSRWWDSVFMYQEIKNTHINQTWLTVVHFSEFFLYSFLGLQCQHVLCIKKEETITR